MQNSLDLLPPPALSALEISQQLQHMITSEISRNGPISFARYMELALYTPGYGYYSNAAEKFGAQGDFITAPEISSLFGECIAAQIAEVLQNLSTEHAILECGAGTGRLAADVLQALNKLNCPPQHYYILELSANLRQRQQHYLQNTLPDLYDRITWLDQLPQQFSGVIIANEVLDAMPVERFTWEKQQLWQQHIDWQKDQFVDIKVPAPAHLITAIEKLGVEFTEGYSSEINLHIQPWLSSLNQVLSSGLILLIDYGFPRHEYYHPQRNMGTLMCHYQHRAHDNFLLWPGLQDITAHVDFTAIAEAAVENSMDVLGYTTQAHFLMSCGILKKAEQMNMDVVQGYKTSQAIKRLLLPSEMGELLKVIALGKNLDLGLLGFTLHDMSEKL